MQPSRKTRVVQQPVKGFARGKHGRLHVFDKHTGAAFQTTPRRVAAEKAFYDIETAAGILTIEPALGDLESSTAKVIQKIRRDGSIAGVTLEERYILAVFIATQHMRTPQFRANVADMDRQLADRLREMGIDPENVQNYKPFHDEEEIKTFSIEILVHGSIEIADTLMQKDWILVHTRPGNPFLIGDSPVTLHNERDFGFYGNIGFAVPGIEIYMPLSDELSLYLTCRSNGDSFRESQRKLGEIKAVMGESEEVRRLESRLMPMFNALDKGTPLEAHPQNVLHHNSLQVAYSERWLLSPKDDFGLAKKMIKDNEAYRRGPRGRVG